MLAANTIYFSEDHIYLETIKTIIGEDSIPASQNIIRVAGLGLPGKSVELDQNLYPDNFVELLRFLYKKNIYFY